MDPSRLDGISVVKMTDRLFHQNHSGLLLRVLNHIENLPGNQTVKQDEKYYSIYF